MWQVNGKGLWGQDKPLLQLLRRTRRRTKKLLEAWWRNYLVPWMQWLCRLGRLSGEGWRWRLRSVSAGEGAGRSRSSRSSRCDPPGGLSCSCALLSPTLHTCE